MTNRIMTYLNKITALFTLIQNDLDMINNFEDLFPNKNSYFGLYEPPCRPLSKHATVDSEIFYSNSKSNSTYRSSKTSTQHTHSTPNNHYPSETKFDMINLSLHLFPISSQYKTEDHTHSQADAFTPSTCFLNLLDLESLDDKSSSSKQDLFFVLDSGASISMLNIPTFTILSDHLLVSQY